MLNSAASLGVASCWEAKPFRKPNESIAVDKAMIGNILKLLEAFEIFQKYSLKSLKEAILISLKNVICQGALGLSSAPVIRAAETWQNQLDLGGLHWAR